MPLHVLTEPSSNPRSVDIPTANDEDVGERISPTPTEEDAMMDWGHNSGWWNGGMIFMGLFLVALIALAVWAVLRLSHRTDTTSGTSVESARHILDRRLSLIHISE